MEIAPIGICQESVAGMLALASVPQIGEKHFLYIP
jgi:hypothetical protein